MVRELSTQIKTTMTRVLLFLLGGCFAFVLPASGQLSFVTSPAAAGSSGQTAAGALNDAWENAQQIAHCGTALFIPVYGMMFDDCAGGAPVGAGNIIGLVQTNNVAYPGMVSFEERLVNEDDSDLATKGTPYTNACGATGGVRDDSDNTMQGEAPSANTLGMIDGDSDGNLEYYNGYASPSGGKKWALLIVFSQAVTEFGMFLGDLESRSDGLDGYPGQIVLFNGSTIVDQQNIPTGTANQSLCDGDANGSFNGCGNDETVWMQYSGAAITDILLVVGEVVSDAGVNANKGSFAGLTLGGVCQAAMPVELLSFRATVNGNAVELFWETRSETNNDFFAIEHSADGEFFQTVGIVPGAGESAAPLAYFFEHAGPFPGRHYYRLRQADFDGRLSFGPVVAVEVESPPLRLSPTLASTELLVQWSAPSTHTTRVEVYDLLGRRMLQEVLPAGSREVRLETWALPAGHYFLRLGSSGNWQEGRFVKQ